MFKRIKGNNRNLDVMIDFIRNKPEIEKANENQVSVEFSENFENQISNIISSIKYGEKLEK